MSDGPALLVVEGLTRRFERGAVRALQDVSFQARAGEIVAVTGPSGCGKSTLLSLVGLLDQPSRGAIRLAGQDLAHVRAPAAYRARHIGFVFQFHHMVPTMTLEENVAAPMLAVGVPRRTRMQRARHMLDAMGISARARALPAHVSGGERQRAAVARALVNAPPLVLADEPTGNLDSRNGRIVVDLLVSHARTQGALVLMATHNPEIAAVADRHLELLDGELVAS